LKNNDLKVIPSETLINKLKILNYLYD